MLSKPKVEIQTDMGNDYGLSKENIEQPYGIQSKPKFVSKPGGYVPSGMGGGEGRVRRGSRPAAVDPFAHVDANPEPYKIPTI
jgi:hypothetical protein